jgi:hypothetical protein
LEAGQRQMDEGRSIQAMIPRKLIAFFNEEIEPLHNVPIFDSRDQ